MFCIICNKQNLPKSLKTLFGLMNGDQVMVSGRWAMCLSEIWVVRLSELWAMCLSELCVVRLAKRWHTNARTYAPRANQHSFMQHFYEITNLQRLANNVKIVILLGRCQVNMREAFSAGTCVSIFRYAIDLWYFFHSFLLVIITKTIDRWMDR